MSRRFGDNGRSYYGTHPWISFKFDLRRLSCTDWVRLGEALSKCDHIAAVPLPPDISAELHQLALVKGIHGSAQIEGNSLSEDQVRAQIDGKLELPKSQQYLAKEIDNIHAACNLVCADIVDGNDLRLTTDRIKTFNRMVLADLPNEDGVIPGEIRTKGVVVGNVYLGPPAGDCEYLLDQLCAWLDQMLDDATAAGPEIARSVAVVRAVLAHLYLAWIHPFGDGNGRTARLIEFQLLLAAGFPTPAGHLLSNYYNKTKTRYYQVLRETSQAEGYPAERFASYAIQGFVEELCEQLDQINNHQFNIMWLTLVNEFDLGATDATSGRRKGVVLSLPATGPEDFTPISAIRKLNPNLAALYAGKTPKTVTRDVNSLVNAGLLVRRGNAVRPAFEQLFMILPLRKPNPALMSAAEIEKTLAAASQPLSTVKRNEPTSGKD